MAHWRALPLRDIFAEGALQPLAPSLYEAVRMFCYVFMEDCTKVKEVLRSVLLGRGIGVEVHTYKYCMPAAGCAQGEIAGIYL